MRVYLQDCIETVIDNRGVTPHKRGTEWQDSGVIVLSANNVKTTGLQNMDQVRYIPDEIYDSWMKIPLERGDIILTSEAPAGEVYYWDSDEKVVLGQRLYGLKIKKSINSKYLKYYLQSEVGQKAIRQQQSGSTVFGISASTFQNIVVELPSKTVQDRIAQILSAIDDRITNNNAICAELEAMAKLLYDYWFVQFDFPDENGKPYKSSGGKMVWSEELKREIPEGWESCRLGKMCSVISGYPFDSSSYDPNGQYSVLTIKNIQDGYIEPITDSKVRCIPHDIPQCDILQPGDILMSLTGNVGRVGLLCGNNYLLNQRASVAKPHNDRHKWFVYFLLRDISVCTQIQRIATGTSQKNVSPMDIHRIAVPYNSQLCDLFSATVDSVVNRIIECNKENSELVSLRDFLLPLLMNGQITFKEADCH